MHFARGNCGHLKAKWDNHPSCITACLHVSPCAICSIWTKKVWNLAEKRRLYATRKSVMTQKRRQKKSKKSQLDLSDIGSFDGSTAPLSYTARGRTHQDGGQGDLESDRALNPPATSHPVPVNQSLGNQPLVNQSPVSQPRVNQSLGNKSLVIQSPVNESLVNQSPVIQSPVSQSLVNQSPVIQSPVSQSASHQSTSLPVTGQPGTGQPGTCHQSFAYDFQTQFIPGYSPVNMPLQNYAPSISSHVSHGSIRRLPNVHTPGYEHSEMSEFPNPATSSKQLIPLETDFSQMSDPSVMIDPPNSTDISQTRSSRKKLSRRDHKSKKRRHRSSSSSSSISRSDSLNSSRRKKKSKRSKHSHKKFCPKTQQDQAPSKPLSGIEHLMESRLNPLLILPQSKLVENTTKYIQNRLDLDKCFRDWICPLNLV